jgi:hypothetical protein
MGATVRMHPVTRLCSSSVNSEMCGLGYGGMLHARFHGTNGATVTGMARKTILACEMQEVPWLSIAAWSSSNFSFTINNILDSRDT